MNSENERIDPETGEVLDVLPTADRAGKSAGQTAGDMISAGQQLLQIRTKNQLMVAIQRPRDLALFEKKLLSMAAAAGEDFFYSIGYKDHKPGCSRRGCNCPIGQTVEGPGVGLARAAAPLYGNCSVDTRIEQESADAFLVRADFVDFENNFTRSETKRISKLLPNRGGGTRIAKGKELDLVYQQGASKVERDVIVRALPKHIIDRAFELAKAASMQEQAPINQQIARLLHRFGELKIGLAHIETMIGCKFTEVAMRAAEKDPAAVCSQLRGILTGIKGGETTIEEVFGIPVQTEPKAPASQAPNAIQEEDLKPQAAASVSAEQSARRRNPFAS